MQDLLEHQSSAIIPRVKFSTRFWAVLLDLLIMWLFRSVLLLLISDDFTWSEFQQRFFSENADEWSFFVIVMRGLTVGLLIFEFFTGLTIAKVILGLRIGDLNGAPAPLKNLQLRAVIKIVTTAVMMLGHYLWPGILYPSYIVSFIWLGGCLLALSSGRQALHDLVGKTAVYRKNDMEQPV